MLMASDNSKHGGNLSVVYKRASKTTNLLSKIASEKTYIDFFSGCGGLSLGLGLAGWNGLKEKKKDINI